MGLFDNAFSGAASGSSFGPWGAAVGAGAGLLSGLIGLGQKHKAHKMLDNMQYPVETMPEEITANENMAKARANTGLIGYNSAYQNIQRGANNALRAAADRRGGLAAISGIEQNANDAVTNLDVANSNAKLGNEKALMGVNNQVAAVKRDLFDKNVRGKYNQDYNYAMGLLGAGNQNFVSGIDKVAGAAGLYGGYGGFNGLFGKGNGGGYMDNYTTSGNDYGIPDQMTDYQRTTNYFKK